MISGDKEILRKFFIDMRLSSSDIPNPNNMGKGYNGTSIDIDSLRSMGNHLGNVIRVKRLDPFVGIGLSVNSIRYNAWPQGDSLSVRVDHTTDLYLKAGARYYISRKVSVYGDVGYDNHTIFSLGISCRFLNKRKK